MHLPAAIQSLPIAPLLPALVAKLGERHCAVLQAPPGAGKSTGAPLALLDAGWLKGGRILMLEPRRLAARAIATRVSSLIGEPVGSRVGYRTRLETKVSRDTRLTVVTEGVLTRMLQSDPALEDVALVIFDEFHERSLHADLGLALCLDARANLREDLRLLVMSATLDAAAVAALLDDAPVLSSEGRAYPVETRHLPRPDVAALPQATARAVRRALDEDEGDILVFLPGAGEIRRVLRLLEESALPPSVDLHALYGDLPAAAQDAALAPGHPGPAEGRARDIDRGDLVDYRGRAGRGRRRTRARLALRSGHRHERPGDEPRFPLSRRSAPRPRRTTGSRRLLPPLAGRSDTRPGALPARGDPQRGPRAAGAGPGRLGRRRPAHRCDFSIRRRPPTWPRPATC